MHRLVFLFLAVFLSGIYLLVFSGSGLLERIRLEKSSKSIIHRVDQLQSENKRLTKIHEKLKKGEQSPEDIVNAGYTDGSWKILFIKGIKSNETGSGDMRSGEDEIDINQLRIVWISISAMVLIIFFLKKPQDEEAE
ncbi:MAG: hypothetical protein MUD12_08800 [Spirochaetes bacterium]|jgi:hypothetical protein|nr:hypothetical protein [Spirochaetota bacterium]